MILSIGLTPFAVYMQGLLWVLLYALWVGHSLFSIARSAWRWHQMDVEDERMAQNQTE
jgi:hypothetical protein